MRRGIPTASAEKWLTDTCDSNDCDACRRRAEKEHPELYAELKDVPRAQRAQRYREICLRDRGSATAGRPAWACLGFDVGGRSDSSAVAVLTADPAGLFCPFAARLPLMGDQRDGYFRGQARTVAALVQHHLDLVVGPVRLVLDATGIGDPVTEMFKEELPKHGRLEFIPTVITGGDSATYGSDRWTVGKELLVQQMQAVLEDDDPPLVIGDFEDAPILERELNAYRGKRTASGRMQYAAAGSGHDDLAVALMLAVHGTRRDDSVRAHSPVDGRRATQADREKFTAMYTSAVAGRWWKN